MDKYKLFIIIFTVFVIALIAVGFVIGGTPISVRDMAIDSTRISNFNSIQYAVENYYQTHNSLPQSLLDLPSTLTTTDPQTQKPFDYKMVSQTNYQLCTVFSTDSKSNSQLVDTYSASTDQHKKGYDCITYILPARVAKPTEIPFSTAAPVAQFTRGVLLKNDSDFVNKTLTLNYQGSSVLTIDYSQASITNLKGEAMDAQKDLVNGDQLEIFGITTQPAKIKASQIKDLSR